MHNTIVREKKLPLVPKDLGWLERRADNVL